MHNHWTLYTGGRIYSTHPVLTARHDSILVTMGRIVMIGPESALRRMAPMELVEVDLAGSTIFPGFCDSHLHLRAFGQSLRRLRFSRSDGPDEIAAQVGEQASRAGGEDWITGRGWSGNLLLGDPPASWEPVEQAAPDHPVALFSHDGHTLWINQSAARTLEHAPGIVRESSCMALAARIPDDADRRETILTAQRALLSQGITAVHNFEGLTDFGIYQNLLRRGELDLQVLLNIADGEQDQALAMGLHTGFGDEKLRIGYVKFYLDGALGSRTALLQAPYQDTGQLGQQLIEPARLEEALRRLLPSGLVPAMHAIGDGAMRLALETLLTVQTSGRSHFRPRIEHAELFPESLFGLANKLDVVYSVQPTHLFDDIGLAEQALGSRSADMLPLARMRDAGMRLQFGSDAPIVTPNPLATAYAASQRQTKDGSPAGGFHPKQRLDRAEAIALQLAGVLVTGAPASFVAYPEDPMSVPAERLLELQPKFVVAGGKLVHGETS